MPARAVRVVSSLLLSAGLLVYGAGCGSSKSTSTASSAAGATRATTSAASTRAASGSAGRQRSTGAVVSASVGGLHASLHGENHAPKVGKPWRYTVHASDASGRPVAGTVDSEFAFGGQVVGRETPPTHRLRNGRLNDNLTFPGRAVGSPLTFRVVVHTQLGSVTLDWTVKVTP